MKEVLSVFYFWHRSIVLRGIPHDAHPEAYQCSACAEQASHCNTELSPTHQRQRQMFATVSGTHRIIPRMALWTKSQPTSFAGGQSCDLFPGNVSKACVAGPINFLSMGATRYLISENRAGEEDAWSPSVLTPITEKG